MQAYSVRRTEIRLLMATALAALLVVAAILFGACGGQEQEQGGPTPTPAPGGATPAAPPAVDPNVPLVEFHSSDKGYSLSYPEGWQPGPQPAETDSFLWSIGDRNLALLQVGCHPDKLSVKSLMLVDAAVAARYGGAIDPAAAVAIQVGGVEGEQYKYNISIGGGTIEHVVAYVVHESTVSGKCGWRIDLVSYGPGSLAPYLPLFDRILASFRFD